MKKKITLQIQGMECPNCAMKLESMEDRLEGVLRAEASYHKALLTVEYLDEMISEAAIRTEIERLGYQAV
ncbi:MAG: cation transporter [Bellilinea sp.]|nr:cation transporter [Bellilinea sp.]